MDNVLTGVIITAMDEFGVDITKWSFQKKVDFIGLLTDYLKREIELEREDLKKYAEIAGIKTEEGL